MTAAFRLAPLPDIIPRPGLTADALRAALAVVAPGRLDEMQAMKDEAFAKAVEWQSLSPVQSWVLAWARDIEIAGAGLEQAFLQLTGRDASAEPAAALTEAAH